MSQHSHHDTHVSIEDKDREKMLESDFRYNRVSTSRFLFYLMLFGLIVFLLSTCGQLFMNRYKGKPDIEVQSSTKYTPEYK